ncbi:phosphatidylglycerophosphatase A [Patescibacteria group bacterium]|nr:phosphatidylglycerophosphatase A [Patescibacteria group bacterium]MBU0963690.1 phosphatidylglycerophosphatase A [Patescibacteria group bacterium]
MLNLIQSKIFHHRQRGAELASGRIFDTVKFGLAKIVDQYQNRWGVMLDDLFAVVYSAVFLFIILWIMRSVG